MLHSHNTLTLYLRTIPAIPYTLTVNCLLKKLSWVSRSLGSRYAFNICCLVFVLLICPHGTRASIVDGGTVPLH